YGGAQAYPVEGGGVRQQGALVTGAAFEEVPDGPVQSFPCQSRVVAERKPHEPLPGHVPGHGRSRLIFERGRPAVQGNSLNNSPSARAAEIRARIPDCAEFTALQCEMMRHWYCSHGVLVC